MFSISCFELPWAMNKKDTSGLDFFISYDLRFKLQNSKHTEHLVIFLHSTPIFHNYHSSSLPNAVDGFLISTFCRYILRNKNLCILFRSRTFRALNVKTPLVRLIRKVVWGHVRLWKSQIQSQFLTEILGGNYCGAQIQTFISQLILFQAVLM